MEFKVVYIFFIFFVSGVIGESDIPIVINNSSFTDIPIVSTVTATSNIPTTPTSPTTAPTTQTTSATTTTSSTTTTKPTTSNGTITTSTTTTLKPTQSPITEVPSTPSPAHKGRKFDGPSFVGGIILASGLMAISFVLWKFYKARTESNYHTL